MDKSVIPNGFYCYGVRVNLKYNNIPYTEDIDFFDYYDKVNILHKIQLYFISPLISISTICIGYLYLEIFSHMIIYILLITTLISFILIHFGEKIRKHIKDLIENEIIENEKFRNFLRIIKK